MKGELKGRLWLSFRNLSRNRRRNLATGIAIAIGFAALLALGGYINHVVSFLRLYTLYVTQVGHITVYKKDGLENYPVKPKDYSLTLEEQEKIQAVIKTLPGVVAHGPKLMGAGLIGNGCKTLPFIATGFDPEVDRVLRELPEVKQWKSPFGHFLKGRGLWEYSEDRGAVALASGLTKLLGKTHVADDFQDAKVVMVDCAAPDYKQQIAADSNVQLVAGSWSGMMNAIDGEIVAHYNSGVTETNNQGVLISLKRLQQLYDTDHVALWSIWLEKDNLVPSVLETLKQKLAQSGIFVDLYPWNSESVAPFYTGILQFNNMLFGFLTVVLLSIVIFSVFNAATMTVIERSQEIGMMRSLGFTKRKVRILFVQEMALLTIIAMVVGVILAFFGTMIINALKVDLHPPGMAGGLRLSLSHTWFTVSGAFLLIFPLSLVTTWFAVKMVAKRNIASLLVGTQR